MNSYKLLSFFFILTSSLVFSQTTVTHKVAKGESIYAIAKKYDVKETVIYALNPKLKGKLLQLNTIVQIPNKQVKTNEIDLSQIQNHTVVSGETLFRISKKYGISIQELEHLNPSVTAKLPIGHVLILREEAPIVAIENIVVKAPIEEVVFETSQIDFLIETASKNIGTRYRRGGTGAKGFDCSGLMYTTFKEINMTLPRSSHQQAKVGTKIDRSEAKIGDLIFFATNRIGSISHVGMITEIIEDEIKFIHSSTSLGVIISSIKEMYYSKRFVQINRIF
ncbi:LysM peptidoglycan-binding domain-containing C40 family peptidase [Lutibacter sp.]|uniref:C40 family peptidase n=1 Tax=Lutibacter sp. TaxID=1925666 RepID=UPI002737196D|nr:LysM peptidoglycan-binding domain-containing C40 family peptidase [Lutibacter sp.]MDP3312835.1 LysM peptidoglycan-binding domain-containing C40 family peptidase [Lutibacter sp.]